VLELLRILFRDHTRELEDASALEKELGVSDQLVDSVNRLDKGALDVADEESSVGS
jgi:hypothetical protein